MEGQIPFSSRSLKEEKSGLRRALFIGIGTDRQDQETREAGKRGRETAKATGAAVEAAGRCGRLFL